MVGVLESSTLELDSIVSGMVDETAVGVGLTIWEVVKVFSTVSELVTKTRGTLEVGA